jgi:hypothetical protein
VAASTTKERLPLSLLSSQFASARLKSTIGMESVRASEARGAAAAIAYISSGSLMDKTMPSFAPAAAMETALSKNGQYSRLESNAVGDPPAGIGTSGWHAASSRRFKHALEHCAGHEAVQGSPQSEAGKPKYSGAHTSVSRSAKLTV